MLDTQLKIFKTVVEKGGFSLAAQELHMTQSSVSQQIQCLESHYGMKLFDRMYHKIKVTQAGVALYPYALELERLYQKTNKTMQALKADITGQLQIGCSMTVGEYYMPEILGSFSRMHPLVLISMEVANTEQITSMVIGGSVSLGFIEGHYEQMDMLVDRQFAGDQLVVIAPIDSKMAIKPMSLAELMNARWIMREKDSGTRRIFEEFLISRGLDPKKLNICAEMGSTQAVMEAVKREMGIAAISRLAIQNAIKHCELSVIPLEEGGIERTFTMIYCKDRFQTCAVEKFISYFIEKVTN